MDCTKILFIALALCCQAAALEIPAANQFEDYVQTEEVTVKIYRPKDGPPWIWGQTQLPRAPSDIFAVLKDFQRYPNIFVEEVESIKVLDTYDDGVRMHVVWPLPFPFSDRDAVVRYKALTLKDNTYAIEWSHQNEEGDPQEGERIKIVQGRTFITPVGSNSATLDFIYYGDLGGTLMGWIEEAAWKGEPFAYFNAIRKQLGLKPTEEP